MMKLISSKSLKVKKILIIINKERNIILLLSE